jgi:hypothetical protein
MWVRIPPGLPRTTVGNSGTGEPLKLEMRVRVSRGALRSVAQFGRALGSGPRGSQVQILSLRRTSYEILLVPPDLVHRGWPGYWV